LKEQLLLETLTTQKRLVLTARRLGQINPVPQMLFGLPPENEQLLISSRKIL